MQAARHLPWPIALLLALVALLLVTSLISGQRTLPGSRADHSSLLPVRRGLERTPRPRTWVEIGNNRIEVWERLERDADLLVLGQELTVAKRGRCVKALTLALAFDDLELARPYLDPLIRELRPELVRQLPEMRVTIDEVALARALYEARTGRMGAMMIGPFRAEVGIATYRHWKTTITETRTDRHEAREEMANTYQPYIRLLMILE
jgi:hypothetical protein